MWKRMLETLRERKRRFMNDMYYRNFPLLMEDKVLPLESLSSFLFIGLEN